MTYLIINNQIVKSKRKLTNLIKSGEPLNINNTSLLKDITKILNKIYENCTNKKE